MKNIHLIKSKSFSRLRKIQWKNWQIILKKKIIIKKLKKTLFKKIFFKYFLKKFSFFFKKKKKMIKIFYFSIKEKTIIVKKFNKKLIIKKNQNLSFKKENKNQVAILNFKKNQKIYKNIFKYTIKLKKKKSKKIYYKILMCFTKPKNLNSFKFFFFIYKFLFYIRRYRKIFFLNIFLSNLKRIFKKKLNFDFLKLILNFVKNSDKKKTKKNFF